MKAERLVKEVVDIKYVEITLPASHLKSEVDRGCIGFIPLVDTDRDLVLRVDIQKGQISDWPFNEMTIYTKVRDAGTYRLLNERGEVMASIEEGYVPSLVPNEYGDYLSLDVGQDGRVRNWSCGSLDGFGDIDWIE